MNPPETDLSSIVARIRNNDTEAFRIFFTLHHTEIFHFLLRYTSRREIAEDLAQDAFVRFWDSRHSLNTALSARGYLFKIARNLALNHIEREKIFTGSLMLKEDVLAHLIQNPEEAYAQAFLMDDFQNAIGQLPERCRAVFILSRFHGLSYAEIASSLDISLQTVKNQMNKAISVLRCRLSHHLE